MIFGLFKPATRVTMRKVYAKQVTEYSYVAGGRTVRLRYDDTTAGRLAWMKHCKDNGIKPNMEYGEDIHEC